MCWADIEYILSKCKAKTEKEKVAWLKTYLKTHIHRVSEHDDIPMCFDPYDIIRILEWIK